MKTVVTLKKDGTIEWIGDEPFLPVIKHTRRRLSNVRPAFAPIKGQLFRLLRRLFGDSGRIAAWTRTWKGPWLVKIIGCGEWSVFMKRAEAVRWELDHVMTCTHPGCVKAREMNPRVTRELSLWKNGAYKTIIL